MSGEIDSFSIGILKRWRYGILKLLCLGLCLCTLTLLFAVGGGEGPKGIWALVHLLWTWNEERKYWIGRDWGSLFSSCQPHFVKIALIWLWSMLALWSFSRCLVLNVMQFQFKGLVKMPVCNCRMLPAQPLFHNLQFLIVSGILTAGVFSQIEDFWDDYQ